MTVCPHLPPVKGTPTGPHDGVVIHSSALEARAAAAAESLVQRRGHSSCFRGAPTARSAASPAARLGLCPNSRPGTHTACGGRRNGFTESEPRVARGKVSRRPAAVSALARREPGVCQRRPCATRSQPVGCVARKPTPPPFAHSDQALVLFLQRQHGVPGALHLAVPAARPGVAARPRRVRGRPRRRRGAAKCTHTARSPRAHARWGSCLRCRLPARSLGMREPSGGK